MKTKFKIFYFLVFFSVSSVFGQSNSEWNPIGLTTNGSNLQNGVEAFYQVKNCKNEAVVLIKFINHNAYAMNAEWNDGAFTKNGIWVSNKKGDVRKSLNIGANETVTGDCTNKCPEVLVVKIHDFMENTDDLKLFTTTSFHLKNIGN